MHFKMRNVLGLTAVAAFGLSGVVTAQQVGDFRSRQNGDWHDSNTWEEFVSGSPNFWSNTANVPGAGDPVEVGHHVDVDASNGDQAAEILTVTSAGQLDVEAGRTLSIDGSSNTTSTISGTVNVAGSSATLEFITNAQSVTISSTGDLNVSSGGFVQFEDAGHTITISGTIDVLGGQADFIEAAQDVTISSGGALNVSSSGSAEFRGAAHTLDVDGTVDLDSGSLEGRVAIEGDGNIANQGFMSANEASGTMRFFNTGDESLTLTDSADSESSPRWRTFGSSSQMEFDIAVSGLSGIFLVANGTLVLDGAVETTGKLLVGTSATVDVNSDMCVNEWKFDHAPGQSGCGGTVDTVGAPLYYNSFVNARGTGGSDCDDCDDPGLPVEDKCRSRRFTGSSFTCDEP